MPKLKISNKRKKWVCARKNTVLKGKPLNYNVSQQRRYVIALESLVTKMTNETTRRVLKFFKSGLAEEYFAQDVSIAATAKKLMRGLNEQFQSLFDFAAAPIADKMVKGATKTSATVLEESFKQLSGGVTIKTNIMSGDVKEIAAASVSENVSLIKSIPSEYMTDVEGAVMRSISTGNGLQDLIPEIESFLTTKARQTKNRAENIALDQTRKVYSSVNKGRMEAVGVKKFQWHHSAGSQKPRKDHIEMDGNIYSFDDLPVIDRRTGERGIPGQAVNCRCFMSPVIEFEDGDPDE